MQGERDEAEQVKERQNVACGPALALAHAQDQRKSDGCKTDEGGGHACATGREDTLAEIHSHQPGGIADRRRQPVC